MKAVNLFTLIILSSAFFMLFACHAVNDTITTPSAFAKTIRKANRDKHPFLMFSGVDTFSVTHIMIENKRRDMTVQLARIDSSHRTVLRNPNTVDRKTVALYMRDSTSYLLEEPHTIPVSKISKIQIMD